MSAAPPTRREPPSSSDRLSLPKPAEPVVGPATSPATDDPLSRGELLREAWFDHGVPVVRRLFDVSVSSVALFLLAPLCLFTMLLVKATSPGPVFYHQIRVGQNRRARERRSSPKVRGSEDRREENDRRAQGSYGRPFRIHKFRTMVVNAEEYGPQWSSRGDSRITPVGRILRLTRLDEIPQFWNVLKGDMSLIGPRPERPYFVDQFAENIPHYPGRLSVRPGITGLAQVNLDYDSSIDDVKKKLELDLHYVEKRSIWLDLQILLKTVLVVSTGKGAC